MQSDGSFFKNCSLSKSLEENSINIPEPTPLTGKTHPVPFMLVADDAFPVKEYICDRICINRP